MVDGAGTVQEGALVSPGFPPHVPVTTAPPLTRLFPEDPAASISPLLSLPALQGYPGTAKSCLTRERGKVDCSRSSLRGPSPSWLTAR